MWCCFWFLLFSFVPTSEKIMLLLIMWFLQHIFWRIHNLAEGCTVSLMTMSSVRGGMLFCEWIWAGDGHISVAVVAVVWWGVVAAFSFRCFVLTVAMHDTTFVSRVLSALPCSHEALMRVSSVGGDSVSCEWVCARTGCVGRWMMDTLGMVFAISRILSDLKIEQRDLVQIMVVSCGKIECVGDVGWVLSFCDFLVMYTLVNVREAATNDSMEIWRFIWLMIEIMQHMFFDHSVIGTWCVAHHLCFAIFSVRGDLLSSWLDFCRKSCALECWRCSQLMNGSRSVVVVQCCGPAFLCVESGNCSQLPVLSYVSRVLLGVLWVQTWWMVHVLRMCSVGGEILFADWSWSSNFVMWKRDDGRISCGMLMMCCGIFFCCQVADCTRFPQSTTEAPQEIIFPPTDFDFAADFDLCVVVFVFTSALLSTCTKHLIQAKFVGLVNLWLRILQQMFWITVSLERGVMRTGDMFFCGRSSAGTVCVARRMMGTSEERSRRCGGNLFLLWGSLFLLRGR